MAFAKQQYASAVAAAAMQAANDEWERSSSMTGFGGGGSGYMPSNGFGGPTGFMGGGGGGGYMSPGYFAGSAMSAYGGGGGGAQSVYGGSTAPQHAQWGRPAAPASVYGEAFGPSTSADKHSRRLPRTTSVPLIQVGQPARMSAGSHGQQQASQAGPARNRERLPSSASRASMAGGGPRPKAMTTASSPGKLGKSAQTSHEPPSSWKGHH